MSKTLVIVESPTKAKTISKFLGKDYTVLSSFGHIRDLPKSALGVDTEHDFKPKYVIPTKAKKAVTELKKAAKDANEVLLATDEDREGEAIAWHIAKILDLDEKKIKRITFHEITKHAIEESLKEPRGLHENLVNAQQARRILDRLVGYELSPLLWKKIRYGLSAGRVQSVALRLVVERERERKAFHIDEYWTIDAEFERPARPDASDSAGGDQVSFSGKLAMIGDKKLEKLDIQNQAAADDIMKQLDGKTYMVSGVEKKEVSKKPPTPFTTSRLQMEANSKLGFSAKQTMALAQKLYETGRITYMRTDSMNLSEKFIGETQTFVVETFGDAYKTGGVRFKTSSKGAQEAHEAIRPTEVTSTPDALRQELDDERMWKLYQLIWSRTVASQLPSAKLERTSVDIKAGDYTFRANGNAIVFDGFMRVYRSATEKILPELASGDVVDATSVTPNQHFTEPPARYSDATLVKSLEEHGIGRPSTYAPTISTLIDREYVERDEGKKLAPLDTAFIVNDVLVDHFPNIVDYEFTAKMEKDLDEVAEGETDWVAILRDFYVPFHENIEAKNEQLKKEDIMKEKVLGKDPETGLDVIVRLGRFGPFVQLGTYTEEDKKEKKPKPKSGSLLKGMSLEDLTLEEALTILELPRTVGTTEDGEEIVAAIGPYGPYVKAGKAYGSLTEEFDPRSIDEATARKVLLDAAETKRKLMEPLAELGDDPNSGKPIQIKNGRFGPYITDGETNVSVRKDTEPKNVTREDAIEMLEKKRKAPKRPRRNKKS